MDKEVGSEVRYAGLHAKYGSFIQLRRGRTYFELSGPPEAELIVFVHALTIWSFTWDDLVARLLALEKYRCLSYDLYARGNSDCPTEACDVALQIKQLAELLEHVKAPKATIIGLSQGGGIAASFAAKHPENVKRLPSRACGRWRHCSGRLLSVADSLAR